MEPLGNASDFPYFFGFWYEPLGDDEYPLGGVVLSVVLGVLFGAGVIATSECVFVNNIVC